MAVTYYAILTTIGASKLANAAALGTTLKITQMAVGDGNGNVPTPDASRTSLVREVRRAPLNRLSIDPANSAQIIAEQVIPESVGGWWIREIGLYDDVGSLVAIANCAPSYKPQLAEGSGRTQTVRMILIVNNTGTVELKIDPSVVLATREYVDSAITAAMNRQDIKKSVRVATTGNITLSSVQTVDGVALVAGDRVLVKNQTTGSQNGIYTAAAGAWIRSEDADENAEVTPGLTVPVETGTQNADTIWQLITDAPIVVGTTALVFQDITNGLARLQSPAFTGSPTSPTPAAASNDLSIATSAFVRTALALVGLGAKNYQPNWPNTSLNNCDGVANGIYRCISTTTDLPVGGTVTGIVKFFIQTGEGTQFRATQEFHDSSNNRAMKRNCSGIATAAAPIWGPWREEAYTDSPTFTGTPTAPNATAGNDTQQLATTAFVQSTVKGRLQLFTASGNFTVLAGVTKLYLSGCAAGGGGGGGAGYVSAGGGGGAGGSPGQVALKQEVTVVPGNTYAVVIGAAGAFGAGGASGAAGSAGTQGGSTTFGGSLLTLVGGSGGGGGGVAGSPIPSGGAAGVGACYGFNGGSNTIGAAGGAGGSGPFGSGGGGGRSGAGGGIGGTQSSGYGAGGGGGGSAFAGAGAGGTGSNGRPGFLVVEW